MTQSTLLQQVSPANKQVPTQDPLTQRDRQIIATIINSTPDQIDLSENSKAILFKALSQNFDICVKTQLQGFEIVSDSLEA
ncbi:MAG: hypothetical protein RMY28_031160 [Nostoc sp. ChiSLP01]|nr:hypothetical protein [Nostoc sp. CmiSLP01]MDZ8288423.1 hypothetical protein [Nostoc sp. ChiSLP01]